MLKKFRFELIDKHDGGYFFFAPVVYELSLKRVSLGLELFGRRFCYLELERR